MGSPYRITVTLNDRYCSYLGNVAHADLVLQVLHTLELWLSVDDTLGDGLLATTALDANAVDNVALLGLKRQRGESGNEEIEHTTHFNANRKEKAFNKFKTHTCLPLQY